MTQFLLRKNVNYSLCMDVFCCLLCFFFLFQNGYATPEYISDYTRVDLGALLRMQM